MTAKERIERDGVLRCDLVEVRNWAKAWLSGEDRSAEAAEMTMKLAHSAAKAAEIEMWEAQKKADVAFRRQISMSLAYEAAEAAMREVVS